MKAATNNFDAENKVGEGGFGSVYKVTAWLIVSLICPKYVLQVGGRKTTTRISQKFSINFWILSSFRCRAANKESSANY